VFGIEETELNAFDGNYFCIKRDEELNYHKLAKLRTGRGSGIIGSCGTSNECGAIGD
jgi:hypothetical protein